MKKQSTRIIAMLAAMGLIMGLLGGRAFLLQAFDARAYAAQAAAQMSASRELIPQRGAFTDRNGVVLASSEPAVRIIADPLMIERNGVDTSVDMGPKQRAKAKAAPGAIADVLVKHLGGKPGDYLPKLTDTSLKHYSVIAAQVPAYTYEQIRADLANDNWFGLYKEDDPIRYYPSGDVAANIVGFMGKDDQTQRAVGAGGLEYALNKQLTGTYGKEVYDTSANGRIPLGNSTLIKATNGTNYQLTIDSEMQLVANQALSAGISRAGAKNGIAVVMNVKTGELLALSTSPSFDSNAPHKADAANLGNTAASAPYEPGSVQKVLTFAALADKGLVTPTTKVEVPASLASGDGKLKDAFPHGTIYLTGAGVLANSSNIGTVLLSRQMDKATLTNYYAGFGLGKKSNVGLPAESSGFVPKSDMPDYSFDQIVFGQGLSVTAIQMAAAIAAVANDGVYNAPRLIKASGTDGNLSPTPTAEPRRVISSEASQMVLTMMESVVTKDDKRAIPNYRVAGKTGTAQRVDATCGCYRGYTASYVGVAPADDPQLLVYVMIDQPTKGSDGSALALPVANQILGLALPRYGIAPSTTPAPKTPLEYTP
ncbi:peptidoglycan D,D-transpeptidase FtsI family protein [Propionibacteriaceae bacterium G1746]|uniref:peptidoglycan D,D-transpeptidase FtsI family protein n=1 Tax=Aestuariimicrobium sp. G57 TaxID=3418485 RepID=UPI003C220E55